MSTLAERREAWRAKNAQPSGGLQARLAAFKAGQDEPAGVPLDVPTPEHMGQVSTLPKAKEYGVGDYVESGIRGVNRGMMDLVDMPISMGNLALSGGTDLYNKVTGGQEDEGQYHAKLPSQFIDEATGGFVTDATSRNIPKGESGLADFVYTAGEFGGTAGMPMASTLAKTNKVTQALRAGGTDATMGLGAATGGAVMDGSPYAQLGGSFIAPMITKRVGDMGDMVKGAVEGFTGAKDVTDIARNNLVMQATQGSDVISQAQQALKNGEQGTLAQITRDGGLFNAESAVNLNTPAGVQLADARNLRSTQTSDMLRQTGEHAPMGLDEVLEPVQQQRLQDVDVQHQADVAAQEELTQQGIQASLLREQNLIDQQASELMAKTQTQADVNVAEEALQRSVEALDPNIKPSDASKDFTETWTAEQRAAHEANVKPLYDEFEQTPVPVEAVADMHVSLTTQTGKAGDGMSDAQWINANRDTGIKELLAEIDALGASPKGIDVQSVAQKAKEVSYNNSGATVGGTRNKAVQTMADNIAKEIDAQLTKSSPEYAEANKAYKLHKETIAPNVYTDMVKKGVPEAEIARKFLKAKEGGATTAGTLAATDNISVVDGFETYLRSVANAEGVDAGFMKHYDELLDVFPDSRALMEDAIANQNKLADAKAMDTAQQSRLTKSVEARQKAAEVEAHEREVKLPQALATAKKSLDATAKSAKSGLAKTRVAKFIAAPNKTIDSLLNSKDRSLELDNFLADIEGIEGAEVALKDALFTRVNEIKTKKVGEGVEFNDDFVASVEGLAQDLLDRGILTKQDRVHVNEVIGRVISDSMMKHAKPNTPSKMSQAQRVAASAVSMALLRGSGQNSLIMANAVRRFILDLTPYAGKETASVRAEMDRMLADPEAFLTGVKFPKGEMTQAQADTFIGKLFSGDGAARRTAVRAVQTDKDREE